MKRPLWPLIALILFAGVLASFPTRAADEASRFYEDALVRYERKDDAGAIIQLKNALKADPGFLAAHMLLGRASLRKGDYATAEVALREAQRRGVARAEYAVPLGTLLLDIGQQKELLDTIPANDLPSAIQLEVMLLRARAHLEINQYPLAKSVLEEARKAHPREVAVLAMQSLAALQAGRGDEALKFAEEATALAPSDSAAWTSRASVAYAFGDLNAALGHYERALQFDPQNAEALLGKGSALMDLRRMGEARQVFEVLSKVDPNEPRATYLRSVIAAAEGRRDDARALLSEVVNLIDPAPRGALTSRSHLALIAGLSHYSLGSTVKAKEYFELYLRFFPTQAGARKPLASIYLSEGDAARAAATLEPVARANSNDPEMLSLLASAYSQLKRHQRASELLEEAARLNRDPAVRTSLGLSLIGARQTELGLEHLRSVLKDDPGQARASIALALKALREQQPRKAVSLMDAVIKREPGNLAALNLSGVAKAAAGDLVDARAAYEKVLAVDRNFDGALLNLVKLDLAERKNDQARRRLDELLKRKPDHPAALYERAMIDVGERRTADAIRRLENLLDKQRDHVDGRIALINIYLDSGDLENAFKQAQGSSPSRPGYIPLQAALARVQLARNDLAGARSTLTALTRTADFEPALQYKIALLQRLAGNPAGAAYSLEKALQGDGNFLPAKVMLGELELAEGKIDAADGRVRELLKSPSATSAVFQLAGDIEVARGRYSEAVTRYVAALTRGAGADAAARLYGAHVRAGSKAQGLVALEKLARERKGDRQVRMVLSSALTEAGRLKEAKAILEDLLKAGDDPVLLNNVANLQMALKDAGAQQTAERAHALSPDSPVVLDTLGWILVQKGQIDLGLKYLREAKLRDPSNAEVRLHLATALAKAGRKDEARVELKEALSRSGELTASEHARALQHELGRN
ncbi:MAG: XrtA/PEP-CTERM system TPR-repeat protein PrsT [Pseudomonadota bacterium]